MALWKYKLTIYSHDRVCESIALIKYRNEVIEPRLPLIKTATDPVTGVVHTAMYWTYLPADYIRLLEYVANEGFSFDAYLTHYDWETKTLSKLGEYHVRKARPSFYDN